MIDPTEENVNKVEEQKKIMGMYVKTHSFVPNDNDEIRYEKDFEQTCIILGKHTNKDVKRMSVKEFYTLIEFVKKENDKK